MDCGQQLLDGSVTAGVRLRLWCVPSHRRVLWAFVHQNVPKIKMWVLVPLLHPPTQQAVASRCAMPPMPPLAVLQGAGVDTDGL